MTILEIQNETDTQKNLFYDSYNGYYIYIAWLSLVIVKRYTWSDSQTFSPSFTIGKFYRENLGFAL